MKVRMLNTLTAAATAVIYYVSVVTFSSSSFFLFVNYSFHSEHTLSVKVITSSFSFSKQHRGRGVIECSKSSEQAQAD